MTRSTTVYVLAGFAGLFMLASAFTTFGSDPAGPSLAIDQLRSLRGANQQMTYVFDIDEPTSCDLGNSFPGYIPEEQCDPENDGDDCFTCQENVTFHGYVDQSPSSDGGMETPWDCGIALVSTCDDGGCEGAPSPMNCSAITEPSLQ